MLASARCLPAIFCAAALTLGCDSEPVTAERSVPPTQRNLVAFAAENDLIAIVRMEAAKHYADRYAEAFDMVVRSLDLSDGEPRFDTPDGFERERNERAAAYRLRPRTGEPVTIEIGWVPSRREEPFSDRELAGLANQARRELGLAEWTGDWQTAAEEAGSLRRLDANGVAWTVFDFSGHADPFARENRFTSLPEFDFEPPAGWTERPKDQFRLAIFERDAEGGSVELTLSKSGGSVTQNVNRWRGQIGLAPLAEGEPPGASLRVDDRDAYSIDLAGDERAIRGVIVPLGERELLFVKLTGPPEGVAKAEADFQAFVESLKLG